MGARCIVLLSLFLVCPPLFAGELEVLFSKETGEISYIRDGGFINLKDAEVTVGSFLSEDNNIIPYAGLMSEVLKNKINLFNEPLTFFIGSRFYAALLTEPSNDIIGLSFGASARYTVRLFKKMPIHLSSTAYYAPEVITSGDNTALFDWHVIRGEIELTDRTRGFLGFRTFEINNHGGGEKDHTHLDDEIHLGLRFKF